MASGLYLHIPFCERRCHYCDFNTYEGMLDLKGRYVEALLSDMQLSDLEGPLDAIYFGGGTPSLLDPSAIGRLIEAAIARYGLEENAEVTLEANPGTADLTRFRDYRAAGVNRLSMGFQAAQDSHLLSLGRIHSAAQSEEAWRLGREAGFSNMSLDLMFGLPKQSMDEWKQSLDWALAMAPDHVSFYGLTIEAGTRFGHLSSLGQLPLPNEDLQADMYEWGLARLGKAGLKQYEISNFSRPGREAIHNQLYWLNQPTLGLGAGAWSFDGRVRSMRAKAPLIYIEAIKDGRVPLAESEALVGRAAMGEAAWLGLRRLEGINLEKWQAKQGISLMDFCGDQAKILINQGLLELKGGFLKLTPKALPLANEVFSALV